MLVPGWYRRRVQSGLTVLAAGSAHFGLRA
jgi:hypothetical protein